ncbi:GIY-YIG nuclease family protein [Acidaminobacterium chupaoyuni]
MWDRIIRIEWLEPLLIEDAIASPLSRQAGLYYITRLFGTKETCLYIGKSANTVRQRLKAHNKDWVHDYRGKIFVRLGKIVYPNVVDAELIDHAESALIFEHGDILTDNTDKRLTYSYSDLYRIENIGNCFELKKKIRMHNH